MLDLEHLPDLVCALGISVPNVVLDGWDGWLRQELLSRQRHRQNKRSLPSAAPVAPARMWRGVRVSSTASPRRMALALAPTIKRKGIAVHPSSSSAPPARFADNDPRWLCREGLPDFQQQSLAKQCEIVASLPHESLVSFAQRQLSMTAKHLEQQGKMKKALVNKNQQIRRLTKTASKLQQQLTEIRSRPSEALDILRHKGRKLTWRGNIVLGLRKSLSLVSASAFPVASLIDTSRWTVTRAELKTWAHVMSKGRAFHQGMAFLLQRLRAWNDCFEAAQQGSADYFNRDGWQAQLVAKEKEIDAVCAIQSQDGAILCDLGLPALQPAAPATSEVLNSMMLQMRGATTPPISTQDAPSPSNSKATFTVGCTFFCGDATNSSIWNRQKLQGLETSSALMVNWPAACQGNLLGAFRSVQCMSLELQKSSFWPASFFRAELLDLSN